MSERRKPHYCLIACALMAFGLSTAEAGSALAQSTPADYPPCIKGKASPSDIEAAKNANRLAIEFSERGDYDKAIQYWRDAYALDCMAHGILINIALAYEKKGNRATAIVLLEMYLGRIDKPNAVVAEKLGRLKAATAQAIAPSTPPPQGQVQEPDPPAASRHVAPLAPLANTSDVPQSSTGQRPFGVIPWIVVGVGGAMTAAGVVMLPIGLGAVSNAKSACGGNVCADPSEISKGNSGRTEIGFGIALAAVGVAAIGSGLTWQFLWNKPAASGSVPTLPHIAHLELAPDVSPHRSGLSMSGSF